MDKRIIFSDSIIFSEIKRPGVHKKTQNKSEKRQKKQTRYKGQGRG